LWADRGLVHIEDGDTNTYEAIDVRDCLHRMDAINDLIRNSLSDKQSMRKHSKSLEGNQNFLDEMIILVRKAQEQGMPNDPSARKDLARRRPTSLVVPSLPTFDL
jgi:hypothetical protein